MKVKIPDSMKGGPQNMQGMIKQAQKMQDDIAALQEDLASREYEVSAGGGAVTIRINGKKEVQSLDIKPEIVDSDDIETLSDILIAGINEAIRKVEDTNSGEMEKITGGLGLPGIPGLF